jgi:tripartite-type tricarboxylate transporter receptor subunit TctC
VREPPDGRTEVLPSWRRHWRPRRASVPNTDPNLRSADSAFAWLSTGHTMKAHRRHVLQSAGAAIAFMVVAIFGHGAWAQAARTIKIVVPIAPGGPTDTLARLLAEQVGRAQGVTMIVENRPGAGTVIGTEAVAHAAPDGNTLLLTSPSFVVNPHLRKLDYDLSSFEPICHLVNDPPLIVVNGASPYRTFADLIDAARAKPGALTLASVGPATPPHIAVEMLKRTANVNITFIAYRGYAPAITALLGEHVTAALADYAVVGEQVKLGKLRALAVASRQRMEQMPDLPTAVELGYGDFDVGAWFGLTAPAKTPKQAVAELAGWFSAALQVPEIKAKLVADGLYPVGICGADFGAFLRKRFDDYGRIIREANIKVD